MKCITSEKNYEIGDEIVAPNVAHFNSTNGGFGGHVQADGTNVHYDLCTNGIFIGDESVFTTSTITAANWELYVHAAF